MSPHPIAGSLGDWSLLSGSWWGQPWASFSPGKGWSGLVSSSTSSLLTLGWIPSGPMGSRASKWLSRSLTTSSWIAGRLFYSPSHQLRSQLSWGQNNHLNVENWGKRGIKYLSLFSSLVTTCPHHVQQRMEVSLAPPFAINVIKKHFTCFKEVARLSFNWALASLIFFLQLLPFHGVAWTFYNLHSSEPLFTHWLSLIPHPAAITVIAKIFKLFFI